MKKLPGRGNRTYKGPGLWQETIWRVLTWREEWGGEGDNVKGASWQEYFRALKIKVRGLDFMLSATRHHWRTTLRRVRWSDLHFRENHFWLVKNEIKKRTRLHTESNTGVTAQVHAVARPREAAVVKKKHRWMRRIFGNKASSIC